MVLDTSADLIPQAPALRLDEVSRGIQQLCRAQQSDGVVAGAQLLLPLSEAPPPGVTRCCRPPTYRRRLPCAATWPAQLRTFPSMWASWRCFSSPTASQTPHTLSRCATCTRCYHREATLPAAPPACSPRPAILRPARPTGWQRSLCAAQEAAGAGAALRACCGARVSGAGGTAGHPGARAAHGEPLPLPLSALLACHPIGLAVHMPAPLPVNTAVPCRPA